MCKATIVIPAYNAANYLEQTLDSIAAQSYTDFECIIIDDGSKDQTLAIANAYAKKDARIKVIAQENSGGPAKPRNVGVSAAQGEYVFIFDSDDIMLPGKISACMKLFESAKADFIFSDFSVIDEQGSIKVERFLNEYTRFRKILSALPEQCFAVDMHAFFKEIVNANFIGTSSVCFRKSLAKDNFLFDETVASGDDILAWVKLAKNARFYYIDKVLHQYRKREGSISTNNMERLTHNKIIVLDKIEKIAGREYVHAEVINKKNEYYYYLAYFYFKQKKYSLARNMYLNIKTVAEMPRVFIALIKTYIAQILAVWSK